MRERKCFTIPNLSHLHATEGGSAWRLLARQLLLLLLLAIGIYGSAQSIVVLDRCDFPYIDPQDAIPNAVPARDSMVYTAYFQEDTLLKAFYVDVNAFGGQQVDRVKVYAILPDSTLRLLGAIAFGTCPECVEGFALVHDNTLQVQNVSSIQTMEMWLQAFNQPPFQLINNLQTLRGVGRISGRIPFCAIGWQVQYSVFSSPNNTSTEFSTYILCPQVIASCPITQDITFDCQQDSIFLRAVLPNECFSDQAQVRWSNAKGWASTASSASLSLSDNLGVYYLTIQDGGCERMDSTLVDIPPFAEAGANVAACEKENIVLAGQGGLSPFWVKPDGSLVEGAIWVINEAALQDGGVYTFHAFDENNCEDTDTLRITIYAPPEPLADFQPPCLGDSLLLAVLNDSAFASIQWQNPDGLPLNPPLISNFQAENAGMYSVVGTDAFGCSNTTIVAINGNQPPELTFQIEETCDSAKVYLFPETYEYQWESGDRGAVFTTNTGGNYQVTVTDLNGCASVSQVEIPQPDGPNIALEIRQPFCPGDLGYIQVIAEDPDRPLIFSKDGGETYSLESDFEDLPYGNYKIVVQDDLGCVQELEATIVAPDSMGVSLNLDSLEVRPNADIVLNASTIGNIRLYQWLPKEIDSGSATTAFVAQSDLNVRLIVEDDRGCRATDGFFLKIVLGEIFSPNVFSPNDDGINERFTLYSDNSSGEIIESLKVFNRWGALVFEKQEIPLNDEQLGWDGTHNGKLLQAGIFAYHAVIRFGNNVRKEIRGDVLLMR